MTHEIILFLAVLGVTVALFIFEWLRVDVVALLVMVTLPWLGLVTPSEALSGLSSNAVVSIIGVIILGHGIDRTGVMGRFTRLVMRLAGRSERRLLALVSLVVGLLSGFIQNIGAAALFLPAVLRLARRAKLAASRLLMPMGFAAILGGTLTMVASGPLILLNDLLRHGGHAAYALFAVSPIGLALLGAGLLYLLCCSRLALPQQQNGDQGPNLQRDIQETWGLPASIFCATVSPDSPLVGRTIEQTRPWLDYAVNVLALRDGDERQDAPWRNTRLSAGQTLALLGQRADVERYAAQGLILCEGSDPLREELQAGEVSGFAEVVIHPRGPLAGKSLRAIALRKHFAVEPILLLSGDRPVKRDFSDEPLRPGDTLVVHGRWDRLRALGDDPSFVLLTPVAAADTTPGKGWIAALCFLGAIALAVAGFPLAISLLSGAVAMILLRVMSIDAAYRAVDWRTVFLLAGLIPLGVAMERSGTAAFVAQEATRLLAAKHPLLLLSAVALLSTIFSLFMSNVAAAVLLVPLVAELGLSAGLSPRALGLLVAVCASNSFVLPTHQVNALLMSPGGYRNADYLRFGSAMTLLFLVVAVMMIYLFYL